MEPENHPALDLYGYCSDQWDRLPDTGERVLKNSEIESALRMLHISEEDWPWLFYDMKEISHTVREMVHEEIKKQREKQER